MLILLFPFFLTQLALILLVFFGLLTYILSLGISLFRIFEKVKFHGANQSRVHV